MKQKKKVSERAFASLVGVSHSTVQRRRVAGQLPKSASQDAKGRWLIDVATGREEWADLAPAVAGEGGDGSTLAAWREARARREAAQASLAEDELRRSRGELVEKEGVTAVWSAIIVNAKNKLLGIPSKLKSRRPHLTREDLAAVEELIRESLEELAESHPRKRARP